MPISRGIARLVYRSPRQTADHVEVYTDTDWAGCPKTRRSTTGGCILIGSHTIKHWSSTQQTVTLSSGEAEFHGVVKACGMGLGYQSLLRDFGMELPVRIWTDSSAAIGISSRQGLGKLRHVDTHLLWVQQAVRQQRLQLRKVAGTSNPADVFTKFPASRDKLIALTAMFDCYFTGGRSASAPKLRREKGSKVTLGDEEPSAHDAGEHLAATLSTGSVTSNHHFTTGRTAQPPTECTPAMPHLEYSPTELEELHPAYRVPGGDDLEFIEPQHNDALLDKGLRIAEMIRKETRAYGRTARAVVGEQQLMSMICTMEAEGYK